MREVLNNRYFYIYLNCLKVKYASMLRDVIEDKGISKDKVTFCLDGKVLTNKSQLPGLSKYIIKNIDHYCKTSIKVHITKCEDDYE